VLWTSQSNPHQVLKHGSPSITEAQMYCWFIHCYYISFIQQWLYSPLLGHGLFFSFIILFTQTVGLLGWVISPSQGRYLHTRQHKHRINAHTDIHALNGIWTHNPRVQASEKSSCLRPCGHCNQHYFIYLASASMIQTVSLLMTQPTP
jgi:hypothetical protein